MSRNRLLYLNTHRLSAYAWQEGALTLEGVFDNDELGLQQFSEYLGKHRSGYFSLLTNVAEEGHALETIPFLQGSDRQTLITRKIGQHFLGTSLAAAISLGYEKTQRKNERLLLSALTNPAHFEPWLRRIADAEAALAGIYTVAQLGGELLKRLGQPSKRCLLLTLQDHSIRESYLVDGHAHFSRMAPLTDSSIAGIASAFAAESGKLRQYLIGQRLIGRDEHLPVFILAHPQTIPSIEKARPESGLPDFTVIDSHSAASKLKLRTLPEDNRCELLFLHLLTTSPPRQQFASETHRHHYQLSQIRRGLIAVGLIALLGGLLFSAKKAYDAHNFRQEVATLVAEESDLNRRYAAISATFPQLGVDNDTLRRLTNRYDELRALQRQPAPSFTMLSHVLDRMPAIILESLDWKNGTFLPSTAAISKGPEIITVQGVIRLDRATTRQTLNTFDQFVEALRADPINTVKVLQRPYDIESGSTLRGGGQEDEDARPRQFSVEITRNVTP